MTTTMNDLATRTWDYLSVSGHPERLTALRDLAATGAFTGQSKRTAHYIERYLEDNPRGFCQDGITKFREKILEQPKTAKINVTLSFEVEGAPDDFALHPGQDKGVVYDLVHKHLDGLSIKDGKYTIRNPEFSDYTASKS